MTRASVIVSFAAFFSSRNGRNRFGSWHWETLCVFCSTQNDQNRLQGHGHPIWCFPCFFSGFCWVPLDPQEEPSWLLSFVSLHHTHTDGPKRALHAGMGTAGAARQVFDNSIFEPENPPGAPRGPRWSPSKVVPDSMVGMDVAPHPASISVWSLDPPTYCTQTHPRHCMYGTYDFMMFILPID